MRVEDMEGWDNPPGDGEQVGLDLAADLITTVDDLEVDSSVPADADVAEVTAPDAAADNLLVEFVETANARDLEALAELFAETVEADFGAADSREAVIEGLDEMFLRYPTMVLTRGDLGVDPIAVAWLPNPDHERFDPIGFFSLEPTDSDEPVIGRLVYVEGLPDEEDLVVEAPEDAEHPEWDDWED